MNYFDCTNLNKSFKISGPKYIYLEDYDSNYSHYVVPVKEKRNKLFFKNEELILEIKCSKTQNTKYKHKENKSTQTEESTIDRLIVELLEEQDKYQYKLQIDREIVSNIRKYIPNYEPPDSLYIKAESNIKSHKKKPKKEIKKRVRYFHSKK